MNNHICSIVCVLSLSLLYFSIHGCLCYRQRNIVVYRPWHQTMSAISDARGLRAVAQQEIGSSNDYRVHHFIFTVMDDIFCVKRTVSSILVPHTVHWLIIGCCRQIRVFREKQTSRWEHTRLLHNTDSNVATERIQFWFPSISFDNSSN